MVQNWRQIVVLCGGFALGLAACGESHDGTTDGSVGMDAGARDAGESSPDGGGEDASVPDAGPPMEEPCDTPGSVEMQGCGRCGTWTRFCTADRRWSYGPCEGELDDACLPGTTGEVDCGRCGRSEALCTDTCEWLATGTCMDEGVCAAGERRRTADGCPAGQTREILCNEACTEETTDACRADACTVPGALEDVPCGMCGTQERFCGSDGVWAYGACMGEHGCVPGTTSDEACGMCGTQPVRCTVACEWEPFGACTGEGTCAPGEMRRISAGCPADQTRLMRCDDTCALVEIEACTSIPPIDIILLFDMTGSHASSVRSGRSSLTTDLVTPLLALGDVAIGVAEYADFHYSSYGMMGDIPFRGVSPPSMTLATVDSGLGRLAMMNGSDAPESGVEALATLAGLTPHTRAVAFTCPAGTTGGGCWRPGSIRVVVAFTDAPNHNGPALGGAGLYQPYVGISPAPHAWPAVLPAAMSERIEYFAVVVSSAAEAIDQHGRMIMMLGQDPATHLVTRSSSDWTGPSRSLVTAITALR